MINRIQHECSCIIEFIKHVAKNEIGPGVTLYQDPGPKDPLVNRSDFSRLNLCLYYL